MIVDTSSREARKVLYSLPTIGTLSDFHTIKERMDECADVLADDNYVVLLDNIQDIVELVVATDKSTLKKLKGELAGLTTTIQATFNKLRDSFAAGVRSSRLCYLLR